MNRLATALRALGPYAAIELLLPGGSLVALSVWGFRNRSMLAAHGAAEICALSGLPEVLQLSIEGTPERRSSGATLDVSSETWVAGNNVSALEDA